MSDKSDHGISSAVYYNTPLGLKPCMECLCGYEALGDSWATCGEELDEHLAEVKNA